MEFTVDVIRKKKGDGAHVWSAQFDGTKIIAETEEDLREKVRLHLLDTVAQEKNKSPDAFEARLKRKWYVRVVEADKKDDDDEVIGWNLFD